MRTPHNALALASILTKNYFCQSKIANMGAIAKANLSLLKLHYCLSPQQKVIDAPIN